MCNDTDIQEILPAYLEKTLEHASSIRVEQHLASCEDCRAELALLGVMAEGPVPDPGESFWAGMPDRIYREIQINKRQEKKRFALPDIPAWISMPRWAWATAAVAVIAAVSWFMVRPAPVDIARTTQPAAGTAMEDSAGEPVDLSELSPEEFNAALQWAQNEFTPIEEAIMDDTQEHTSGDLSEELSGLTDRELDHVYDMLNKKEQERQTTLRKMTGKIESLG